MVGPFEVVGSLVVVDSTGVVGSIVGSVVDSAGVELLPRFGPPIITIPPPVAVVAEESVVVDSELLVLDSPAIDELLR